MWKSFLSWQHYDKKNMNFDVNVDESDVKITESKIYNHARGHMRSHLNSASHGTAHAATWVFCLTHNLSNLGTPCDWVPLGFYATNYVQIHSPSFEFQFTYHFHLRTSIKLYFNPMKSYLINSCSIFLQKGQRWQWVSFIHI